MRLAGVPDICGCSWRSGRCVSDALAWWKRWDASPTLQIWRDHSGRTGPIAFLCHAPKDCKTVLQNFPIPFHSVGVEPSSRHAVDREWHRVKNGNYSGHAWHGHHSQWWTVQHGRRHWCFLSVHGLHFSVWIGCDLTASGCLNRPRSARQFRFW